MLRKIARLNGCDQPIGHNSHDGQRRVEAWARIIRLAWKDCLACLVCAFEISFKLQQQQMCRRVACSVLFGLLNELRTWPLQSQDWIREKDLGSQASRVRLSLVFALFKQTNK